MGTSIYHYSTILLYSAFGVQALTGFVRARQPARLLKLALTALAKNKDVSAAELCDLVQAIGDATNRRPWLGERVATMPRRRRPPTNPSSSPISPLTEPSTSDGGPAPPAPRRTSHATARRPAPR